MKARLIAIAAITAALVVGVQGQTMVEYSNLAAHAAKSLATPIAASEASRIAPQKTNEKSAEANSPVVWEDKTASKNQPVATPAPPAVFILSNGERVESAHYLLTFDSLRVQQGGTQRTIPLSAVNLNATIAANHERGIDLKVPTSRAQIMLGF